MTNTNYCFLLVAVPKRSILRRKEEHDVKPDVLLSEAESVK